MTVQQVEYLAKELASVGTRNRRNWRQYLPMAWNILEILEDPDALNHFCPPPDKR